MHIFLSGSEDTGKSHLVKVLYNVISKRLLYDCKYPEKLKVFLLGKTGTPAVDIGEITIHFTLVAKPGTKLLGLNEKSKFKYEDLSEVERQNNKLFIHLLNKLRVDSTDENVNKLLKSNFYMNMMKYI